MLPKPISLAYAIPSSSSVNVLPSNRSGVWTTCPAAGSSRGDFVLPAVWLAGRRAVALTLTPPSSEAAPPHGRREALNELERERRLAAADVIAVRRAIDYLSSLPQVDPMRIAFVGWSLGARTGAILAGVEPRLRVLVLMSAGASPVETYVEAAPQRLRASIR